MRGFIIEEKALKDAIESQHSGAATLAQSVPVRETFRGQMVSEGVCRHRRAVDEKALRKHFRDELNSGKFKVDMLRVKPSPS
jgi:hypothetical protein